MKKGRSYASKKDSVVWRRKNKRGESKEETEGGTGERSWGGKNELMDAGYERREISKTITEEGIKEGGR